MPMRWSDNSVQQKAVFVKRRFLGEAFFKNFTFRLDSHNAYPFFILLHL